MYCVYKHTVPNGKVYIGITKRNPLERWENGHGYKDNIKFFNDIILYGWLNIKHEILFEELTEYEARNKEAELIAKYKSYLNEYGYNVQKGLQYGFIHKQMTREEYKEYCKTDEYKNKCIRNGIKLIRVIKCDLNGVPIEEYNSIREAAKENNVSKYGVRDCIHGKQRTHGGFIWITPPPPDEKF